jgi:excisionase family DNA binding protein
MPDHIVDDRLVDGAHEQPVPPRFYPYAEVAKMFGRSTRTVRLWVASGRLKAIKIGAAPFIPDTEIQRLLTGGEG